MLIFIPILSYALGFYFNENSAGIGGYAGDSDWIRKNIEIFKTNSLKDAILHPEFFGNRSPLIYIINKNLYPKDKILDNPESSDDQDSALGAMGLKPKIVH